MLSKLPCSHVILCPRPYHEYDEADEEDEADDVGAGAVLERALERLAGLGRKKRRKENAREMSGVGVESKAKVHVQYQCLKKNGNYNSWVSKN